MAKKRLGANEELEIAILTNAGIDINVIEQNYDLGEASIRVRSSQRKKILSLKGVSHLTDPTNEGLFERAQLMFQNAYSSKNVRDIIEDEVLSPYVLGSVARKIKDPYREARSLMGYLINIIPNLRSEEQTVEDIFYFQNLPENCMTAWANYLLEQRSPVPLQSVEKIVELGHEWYNLLAPQFECERRDAIDSIFVELRIDLPDGIVGDVLDLYHFENLGYSEIAEKTGILSREVQRHIINGIGRWGHNVRQNMEFYNESIEKYIGAVEQMALSLEPRS